MFYCFQLGREFKLSIAEITTIFPNIEIVFWDKKNLVVQYLSQDDIIQKASRLGGTIKISKISQHKNHDEIYEYIYNTSQVRGGKFQYGVSIFGKESDLKKQLTTIKKYLKEKSVSSRFVNQDFSNISSAIINGEKLVEKGSDFTIINTGETIYLGQTIWVQDIASYSKRDYGKSRDMQIGMLPPKLSQIMINISGGQNIYDPFCGLGTILIESRHMGNKEVYGSDFNPEMVEATKQNLLSLSLLGSGLGGGQEDNIFLFDARDIADSPLLQRRGVGDEIDAIVTEGFLGEIMTKKNISHDRIDIQRKNLSKLYEKFFSGLKAIGFEGKIVMSFPFWEIDKKYIYFTQIYTILEKYTHIESMFPEHIDIYPTKSGSLLYKRENQLVGREIFKLSIK